MPLKQEDQADAVAGHSVRMQRSTGLSGCRPGNRRSYHHHQRNNKRINFKSSQHRNFGGLRINAPGRLFPTRFADIL